VRSLVELIYCGRRSDGKSGAACFISKAEDYGKSPGPDLGVGSPPKRLHRGCTTPNNKSQPS
jgi:hypothetical protein